MKSPTRKKRPAVDVTCAWCGTTFKRWPSTVRTKNYCSRDCYAKAQSKTHNPDGYKTVTNYSAQSANMKRINAELNPTRMTDETRAKLREAHLGKGDRKTYQKIHGRHVHRVVAEQKIGRPLHSDEIVHHIDGDIHNNAPENLQVMTQSDHINLHRLQGDLRRKTRK
ncbi:HNH endonuclease signature motif containing protein [uncultured Corynebacterium sp.]|uniref:HNH endonuclease signature motif containing protein n=1 Tax=uncultured Corynebacterium sp. TaxID=159447 RepID=UPI0025947C46|nr:HNH endonuclease signature motif containing protein [uncultured Corynebacterium sp.]